MVFNKAKARILFIKAFFLRPKRAQFYEKMAALMKEDVPMMDALQELRLRSIKSSSKNDTFVLLLDDVIYKAGRQGYSLGAALKPYVSNSEHMLLESSGSPQKVVGNLEQLAKNLRALSKATKVFVTGLLSPTGLLLMIFGALYYMGTTFIPEMTRIFPADKWQGAAREMLLLSNFVQTAWVFLIPVILLTLTALIIWSFPRWTGPIRAYADRLPPWSFYRIITGGSWLIALSSLMKAGERQYDILEKMAKESREDNPWLYERLRYLLIAGRSSDQSIGESLSTAGLECSIPGIKKWRCLFQFPDKETVDDLGLYSRLKVGEEKMQEIGDKIMNRCVKQIEIQTKIVNSVIGGISFLIVFRFIQGMYEIYSYIGSSANL